MEILRPWCMKSKRLPLLNDDEFAAFKKELGAIEIQGIEGYFEYLIRRRIKVNNECNSMVAWVLGLSDNKPKVNVKYKGGTLPDIDIDIGDTRRSDVINYVVNKYGNDHVAGIGTYGFMWAKGAIRYAGRALNKPLDFVNNVASLVPEPEQGKNWHVEQALENSKPLKDLYDKEPEVKELIDWAAKIDGTISNKSQHAAGICISEQPISMLCPTFRNKDNFPVLEFVGPEAEDMSLVKMDFLGLRTLTIMQDAINQINRRHNLNLSIYDIPIDDPETFKLFSTGKLLGVFQLEGGGISNYTRKFEPKNLMDITLISAGYRPGPIDFLDDVLKTKNGQTWTKIQPTGEKFPILKDVLAETYGYFLYQEQIQKVVQELAGYTDQEGDEFRKIISKKIAEKMPKEKDRFTKKALEKGMSIEDIQELWDQMESFAAYCFNKSHALAYSILTVRTAWLKVHYPAEFFSANIINEIGDQEKVTDLIMEAPDFNVRVLPPDVNESLSDFAVISDKVIRFGLGGISNVGINTAEALIEQRNKGGKYKSVSDFIFRTNVRSNILGNMVKAGCFDKMIKRSQGLFVYPDEKTYLDKLLAFIKYFRDSEWIDEDTQGEWIELPVVPEYPALSLADMEKEMNGLYLSYHPLKILAPQIEQLKKQKKSILVGYPSELNIFRSGKGCKFKLDTGNKATYNMLVVGTAWQEIKPEIKELMNDIVICDGRANAEDGTIFVKEMTFLMLKLKSGYETLDIDIPLNYSGIKIINKLKEQIIKEEGKYKVFANFKSETTTIRKFLGYTNSIN